MSELDLFNTLKSTKTFVSFGIDEGHWIYANEEKISSPYLNKDDCVFDLCNDLLPNDDDLHEAMSAIMKYNFGDFELYIVDRRLWKLVDAISNTVLLKHEAKLQRV